MNRRVLVVTIMLVLSFSLRVWLSAVPVTPVRESLANFPKQAGPWTMVKEEVLDNDTARVLNANDYVMRRYQYQQDTNQLVDLFIAYYNTQKAGESMHSPKNCLPGAGWGIVKSDEVPLRAGDPNPTMINRYLIEKDGLRALVLYWYQASGRVVASEYWGKIYLVLDAIRTGRRDGAIVRFVVLIRKGSDGDSELESALEMAQTTVPLLPNYLPN